MKKFTLITLSLVITLLLITSQITQAQPPVNPVGVTSRPSSQLILPFLAEIGGFDFLTVQVTNTSTTQSTAIHVQIIRSQGDTATGVRCEDRDFTDTLTPLDTHVYNLEDIVRNIDGVSTGISAAGFEGFVVITPIVSETDLTALSFQNLIGTSNMDLAIGDSDDAFVIEAMGRDAINLATGAILPNGTVLDGTTNGFVILQPEEIIFDTALTPGDRSALVSIGIVDTYLPGPAPGYVTEGANYTLRYFFYDVDETINSCSTRDIFCYDHRNINTDYANLVVNKVVLPLNDPICGADTFQADGSGAFVNRAPLTGSFFVENLSANTSVMFWNGYTYIAVAADGINFSAKATWSQVAAEGFGQAPTECAVLPDECGNPNCKPLPGCENPDGVDADGVNFCQDGVDNDGVNGTDCADFGCDGFVAITSEAGEVTGPCESSGETSCADEFDNDNNGFVDCGLIGGEPDPNCVAIGACGDDDDDSTGGDGGNCSIAAGSVATGTAAANFLLPLLPLAGAYALRRIRRRSIK